MGDSDRERAREALGRAVRQAWLFWALEQPDPKPGWLLPWEDMPEADREADRRIGEAVTEPLTAVLAGLWAAILNHFGGAAAVLPERLKGPMERAENVLDWAVRGLPLKEEDGADG